MEQKILFSDTMESTQVRMVVYFDLLIGNLLQSNFYKHTYVLHSLQLLQQDTFKLAALVLVWYCQLQHSFKDPHAKNNVGNPSLKV